MILEIRTLDDLELARHHCHDALFEPSEAVFNKSNKVFLLPFVREMWEKAKPEKSFWIFHRWRIPKTQAILLFHNVIDVSIKFKEPGDWLETIEYKAEEKTIILNGIKGSILRLDINSLSGKLEDQGDEYFDER